MSCGKFTCVHKAPLQQPSTQCQLKFSLCRTAACLCLAFVLVQAAVRGLMSREHQMLTWHTIAGDLEAKQKALAEMDKSKVGANGRGTELVMMMLCVLPDRRWFFMCVQGGVLHKLLRLCLRLPCP